MTPRVLCSSIWRQRCQPSTAGAVDQRHVDVFAHIVLAAANEVAMMIALAGDSGAALSDAESALVAFLDRLLGAPGRS